LNPQDWLKNNQDNFGSPYEEMFFCDVLSRIALDFDSLITQFKFKDFDGKTRYCDFVYQEGSAIRIAIEIDGYDKRGTGTGMNRADFVDWQRRQAALTAQGWFVLRFANIDVRDEPERCKKHIELLLRNERQKRSYQSRIENIVHDLKNKLASAEEQILRNQLAEEERKQLANQINTLRQQLSQTQKQAQHYKADEEGKRQRLEEQISTLQQQLSQAQKRSQHNKVSEEERQDLIKQIDALRQQLQRVQQEKPLNEDEKALLLRLNESQRQLQIVNKENSIMKTTIWSLTVIVVTAILAPLFKANIIEPTKVVAEATHQPAQIENLLANNITQSTTNAEIMPVNDRHKPVPDVEDAWSKGTIDPGQLIPAVNIQHSNIPGKKPGTSCQNPISWENASGQIGRNVAIKGHINKITFRQDVKGEPTWIEIRDNLSEAESLTLIIWGNNRPVFESMLTGLKKHDEVCAMGSVSDYKGKPQIKLSSLDQLYVYHSIKNNYAYHQDK